MPDNFQTSQTEATSASHCLTDWVTFQQNQKACCDTEFEVAT